MSQTVSTLDVGGADLLLTSALTKVHTRDELLTELASVWVQISDADSCDILYREHGDGLVLKASTLNPEMTNRVRLGKGVGLCGKSLLEAEPVYIESGAPDHPQFANYPDMDESESHAVAILPLIRGSEEAYGVVHLRKAEPWSLSTSERSLLEHYAALTANLICGFKNVFSTGQQLSRLGALSEVTRTITTSPYLEEILQLLVHLTAQQFNYKVCTVRLLDENRNELVLRATQAPAKAYQRKRAIKLGESIAGKAIKENRAIIVPDVQVEDDYIGHDLAVEQGLRSMICVPLMLQDKPVGVLSCYTSEVRDFNQDEIRALETLAKQAAVSIEHAKLQVRNTLMQEMHHRVKNNLQQVASLLRLQMRSSSYRTLEEALNDCLARILAIAAVHDLLSREDLDHVGIRSIAESLVHHQQSSLVLPNRSILFLVRGHEVRLNMTQATQLALVLNELISNAVEHGFDVSRKGEVHVTVEENDREVSVWVSNSGDPLPEEFDPTKTKSLGLQIVDNLSRALGGRFKISNVMGWTVAEVRFIRATGE